MESPSPYVVSKESMDFLNVLFSSKPIKDEKAIIDAFKKGFVNNAILNISPNALSEFEGVMKRYLDIDLVNDEYCELPLPGASCFIAEACPKGRGLSSTGTKGGSHPEHEFMVSHRTVVWSRGVPHRPSL